MKSITHIIVTLPITAALFADTAFAGGRATLVREAMELVSRRGGQELAERAGRESAEQLFESTMKELGPEVLQLEAKAPGLARKVFTTFGRDEGLKIATMASAEDLPRLVAYAERADSPQTRSLLLEAYKREGRDLFDRIPPRLILAGGLTAAMIYGTHRATAPMAALGTQITDNPDLAARTVDWIAIICGAVILTVTITFLWRLCFFRRPPASAMRVDDSANDEMCLTPRSMPTKN